VLEIHDEAYPEQNIDRDEDGKGRPKSYFLEPNISEKLFAKSHQPDAIISRPLQAISIPTQRICDSSGQTEGKRSPRRRP